MKTRFAYHITKYFSEYLPLHIGASENTCKSYRDVFVQLLKFIESEYHLRPDKIDLGDLSSSCIEAFLLHIEKGGVSVSTRNQRLAAIHSFARYLQKKELPCFEQCSAILDVPFKKAPSKAMAYLSINEIQILLSIPDSATHRGIRELAMLSLLYDAGARVQELIDLKRNSLYLDHDAPSVELHGKGKKNRKIPISDDVADIMRKYLEVYWLADGQAPLFLNSQGKKLTRAGIRYILDKNLLVAKTRKPSHFKQNITNHSLRHSKAMHLVEAGVNLIYIRDFLGHFSVTTTEVYARANPEIKRKILVENSIDVGIHSRYRQQEKDDLMNWLMASL